jgi:outer membrane protein
MRHRPTIGLSAYICLTALAGLPCLAAETNAVQPASTPAAAPLSLSDAVSMAATTSPTVIAARQQFAQAQAKVEQARAQTRLTLSFNSTASESNAAVATPPPDQETFGTIVNAITLPLPIGRKPQLAVAQAEAQAAAARAQYDGAVRTQTNTVIADYFDVLKKQAQLDDARLTLTQAQRQLDEARLRNKAGDVPDLDVIRAQAPVASAQASIVQAQNAVDIAGETLNAAIGRSIATPLTVAAPTPPAVAMTSEDVQKRAVEQSADVQAAQATITAEQRALEAAKLWREPALSLQASDTRSGDVTSFSRQDTIQASVTIPLSDGGLARGQAHEAEAAIAQAYAQVDAATLTVQSTASAAYHNAESMRRQADAAKVALDIAQTAYDKTVLGYHNGLFPFTDVLSAQTALAQARSAYTQALYDAGAAEATLNALIAPTTTTGKVNR